MTSNRDRRQFLKGSGLAVGVLATEGCAVSGAAAAPCPVQQVASFGWEDTNLAGNGANMYFKVPTNMVLNAVDVDISAMILASNATGFAEVLHSRSVSASGSDVQQLRRACLREFSRQLRLWAGDTRKPEQSEPRL